MMRIKHCATSDPRWVELVEKYQSNWNQAMIDIFGMTPTDQQKLVIERASKPGSHTTVTTPSGIGCKHLISAIAIILVILYPNGRVIIPSMDVAATKSQIMKYMKQHWYKAIQNHPWLDIYFDLTSNGIHERSTDRLWFSSFKSVRKYPESIAGEYAKHLFFICPNANSLSEKIMGIINASLVERDNGILLTGIPSEHRTYFYHSHHRLSGDLYSAIQLSAEDSPLVTPEYIEMKRRELGGRDTNAYRMQVLGLFPNESSTSDI